MSYGIKTLMIYLVKMDTQTINGIDSKRLFDVVNEVKKILIWQSGWQIRPSPGSC